MKLDLTGKIFNRLTVLRKSNRKGKRREVYWVCQCNCIDKTIKEIVAKSLTTGTTKSCGCLKKELFKKVKRIRHGLQKHPLYKVWQNIKVRCLNKNNNGYKNYGGRGIIICDEWKNDFKKFYDWAIENGWKKELSIDRINNNGNYCPENCRWTTRNIQNRNKRNNIWITAWGETKLINDWAKDIRCTVNKGTIRWRLKQEYTPEEAIGLGKYEILITAFGETKNLTEWIKDIRIKVSLSTLFNRLKKGLMPEEALTLPSHSNHRNYVYIIAWNERKTLRSWGKDKRCNVTPSAIQHRLKKGWSPEDAISMPKYSGK